MGDARGNNTGAQGGEARVLAVWILDVETNGREIDVNRDVQIIFEKNIYGENPGPVRIGFAECFLGARRVGVGIGGDGESLMRVFRQRAG